MKKVVSSLFLLFILSIVVTPAVSLANDWEACYGGLLRCDENGIVWQSDSVSRESQTAQLSSTDGLEEFLTMLGTFMNNILVPLLLAIALLFFLINSARFFVIEATNSDKKEEAKRAALYGILAFVFIVSLWGIVNLLVSGLGIAKDESICPDYIIAMGGDCGNIGGNIPSNDGGGSGSNGNNSGTGNTSGGTGGNTGGGTGSGSGTGGNGTNSSTTSKLGVLLYGRLEDISNFNFRAGVPRAQSNTVIVNENVSCVDGLTTLQLAATTETNQSSYFMYKQGGNTKFKNLTDIHTYTSIDIDADTMNATASSTKPVVIHTHPRKTTAQLALPMTGQAPSKADMELLCDNVANNSEYLVLDGTTVWSLKKTPGSCPRTPREADDVFVIDTLLQLSLLDGTTRQAEYNSLMAAGDIPSRLKTDLRQFETTSFSTLSSNDVFLLADNLARTGRMQIQKHTVNSYCAGY